MTTPVMLVTANVGSVFEEPTRMVQAWAAEFLSTVSRLDPKFVALHCQEVGGKNYEKSMQYVDSFVQLLLASEELRLFDKVRIYLDEDFSSADKFTALGNFYFIHESLSDVLIYDFSSRSFVEVDGVKVFTDDMEAEPTKEKSKFPLEYFPECKWSRKGFLRTRWSVNGTIFDLVNIHLFHDASNFVAIQSFPSEYSETRRQALIYTLDRFTNDENDTSPVFLFGDFNFRTDTKAVVKRLSEGLARSEGSGEDSKVEFSDGDGRVLSLGKKTFSHLNHQDIFCDKDAKWLREFDKEMDSFREQLFEFDIGFQPSYPFEEGETGGKRYMETRCPAWCDRVLLTKDALPLVNDISNAASVEYGIMGTTTCMGDHKPVYLRFEAKQNIAKEAPKEVSGVSEAVPSVMRGDGDAYDRFEPVKRVNSASFVENRNKREDWQSARCNSDVSWNPAKSRNFSSGMRKPILHGSSRIRLVSPSASVNCSLPRLTSHHSSSDEEWFEVIDCDDDVLEMRTEGKQVEEQMKGIQEQVTSHQEIPESHQVQKEAFSQTDIEVKKGAKDRKPFSIFKRLSKQEPQLREGVEAEPSDVEGCEARQTSSRHFIVLKTQTLLKSVQRRSSRQNKAEDLTGSWESIDLTDPKPKDHNDPQKSRAKPASRRHCCVLQ